MAIGDYIAAKDAADSAYEVDWDDKSIMALYIESKDSEEEEEDDRSLMQVYTDSKDAEDDPR